MPSGRCVGVGWDALRRLRRRRSAGALLPRWVAACAGTTHWITAGGFRPSVRVKRERRRMLMAAATQVAAGGAAAGNTQGGGGGGGAGGRRDVFDADELASQLA